MTLCLLGLFSCSSGTESTQQPNVTTNNPIIEDLPPIEDNAQKSGRPLSYDQYPFGCPTVANFAFTNEWRIIDRSGTRDMGFSVYQKALLDINKCLQQINNYVPIAKPKIKKTKYIKYFSEDDLTCDNIATTDSIIIKLPNLGKYKSYYAFGNVHNESESDSTVSPDGCSEYGNLVLIDSASNEAKVLNLYLMKQLEDKIYLRLFYIDEKETIHIMEVNCDTRECHILNQFTATIDNSGRLLTQKK